MIRLVAYDLDGTVLNDMNQIVGEAVSAIKALLDRGIAIASISGRNVEKSQEPFAAEAGIIRSTYLGCYNGAVVLGPAKDGGRSVLHEQRMGASALDATIEFVASRGLNFVYCSCRVDDGGVQEEYIADRDSESVRKLAVLAGLEMVVDEAVITRIRKGEYELPPKLLILPGPDTRDRVLSEMLAQMGDTIYMARTGDDRIEVMHPEVNKAVALKAICREAGVPPESSMAIGDGDNDLPMLEAAGTGVLMANADEATQKAAGPMGVQLTASLEADGFSNALHRFALDA
jgi:Cof subfamily protein (haloacid dehalogenase superfamily)